MLETYQREALAKLKILYVEDEADILKFAKIAFEDIVDEIVFAQNGEEALQILTQRGDFDIVITDILMPKCNGIDMIREIRRRSKANSQFAQMSIIVATAHTQTQYLLDSIELGVDGYILKPITVEEMFRTVLRAAIPKLQKRELDMTNSLLDVISVFVGGKKIEIIRYLINKCDNSGVFFGSYEDIVNELGVSKPTVVKTFKQLINTGLLSRLKNKVYKFVPNVSKYKGI